MKVTVRLFAILRQRAGRDTLELDLPEDARVSDALAEVDDLAGGLTLVMAVNREYAAADHPLAAGDELALIPPVSGGATTAPHVAIREEPLSADAVVARVRDPRAGAVVVFEGVTRDVGWLDYRPTRRWRPSRSRRSSSPRSSATACARRRPSTASAACR